ncbi:DUF2867 domain-containing protein [Rhizobium rhizogenes]|uniref:DUF2867 domain-containing protein n=2 Tax=Rhizobium rhizogenes TaxID=359 RepID=A0AA88EXP7_RHIRH|nr:DUF2867 domain-containing protein [Rhizobium rhizogenes]
MVSLAASGGWGSGMRDSEDILPGADWWDRFQGEMVTPESSSLNVSRLLLDHPPAWISSLMALRNRIVSLFGLRTVELAAGDSAGGFPVLSSTADRTVLGFDDSHLDFRIVVDLEQEMDRQVVTVTTIVRRKNRFGSLYLFMVGPFHRRIVPATMRPFCANVRPV